MPAHCLSFHLVTFTHINTQTVSIIRRKVSMRHFIISCATNQTNYTPQTVQRTSFNGASGGQEPLSGLNCSLCPIPTAPSSATAGIVVLLGQGLWMMRSQTDDLFPNFGNVQETVLLLWNNPRKKDGSPKKEIVVVHILKVIHRFGRKM